MTRPVVESTNLRKFLEIASRSKRGDIFLAHIEISASFLQQGRNAGLDADAQCETRSCTSCHGEVVVIPRGQLSGHIPPPWQRLHDNRETTVCTR